MQYILNRIYGYNSDITPELIDYAKAEIIQELSYSYADLLKAYSAGNIRLLKAIAQEGIVKEILSGSFISKHRLRAASSVSTSLKKLIEKYKVDVISIGNGTASKESEIFVADLIKDNRFGFEEVIYLLLFGELPQKSELT